AVEPDISVRPPFLRCSVVLPFAPGPPFPPAPMTRVALVTGGTRGIGLGIARALAAEGWSLALCGVRPAAEISGVVSELKKSGGAVHYVATGRADRTDRHRLVDEVRPRVGSVHALVNNAGSGPRVRPDLLEASEESFEEIVRTNLQGPYFLTQAIARDQIARRAA